jgi:hypothetical protein
MKLKKGLKLINTADDCINVTETPSTLEQARKKPTYFTRTRKMNFQKAVYFLLNMLNESTQVALNRFFKNIGEEETHMSQQAFSKTRSHFDHSPFEKMFRRIVQRQYNGEYEINQWNEWKVLAIDGTAIALPNTKELRDIFGVSGIKADSATARGSILYDVLNDRIMDAAIGKYSRSEREFAKDHIAQLANICEPEHTIIIFDRGYPSLDLIHCLHQAGLYFLMRVRKKWNLAVDSANQPDSLVKLDEETIVRVVKFHLSSGDQETLITNLFDLSAEAFPTLYFYRWPVEAKFDVVKNKLELENFSGRTENAVLQDFWTCMLLANIAAVAKDEANELVREQHSGKDNKYVYIPNLNQLIGSLKDTYIDACFLRSKRQRIKRIKAVIAQIARAVIPIRPGRSIPRPLSPRKSKFHHNHKSNC